MTVFVKYHLLWSQAAQALAVRCSSCKITVMAELLEFVGKYLRPLKEIKIYIYKAFLMYVENLEMDNSLKWVLFIKVNGQITSDTLSKLCEVFLLRI